MTPQELIKKDGLFRCEVLSATPNPQQVVYAALHQDYSEGFVFDELQRIGVDVLSDLSWTEWSGLSEQKCGEIAVKKIMQPYHFGPLEHPQIILNFGWFPHSVMQQVRTHRTGISFDVQSGRYTGKRILDALKRIGHSADLAREIIPEIFYIRPPGQYSDRQGKHYSVSDSDVIADVAHCWKAMQSYVLKVEGQGWSEEHARGLIPFDVRQHFVMSCNLRTALHLLDMRYKADAQLEAQAWAWLLWLKIRDWVPEIAAWYEEKRLSKGRLAP